MKRGNELNVTDKQQRTLLHYAASYGCIEAVMVGYFFVVFSSR